MSSSEHGLLKTVVHVSFGLFNLMVLINLIIYKYYFRQKPTSLDTVVTDTMCIYLS